MEFYDALIAKWETLTGSTSDKLSQINSLMIDGPIDPIVAIVDVMHYLRSNGLWLPIKSAATTNEAAAIVVDLNEDLRVSTIDFSLPVVSQILDGLVSTNLLSTQNVSDLKALTQTKVLWTYANGYAPINEYDLECAGGLS